MDGPAGPGAAAGRDDATSAKPIARALPHLAEQGHTYAWWFGCCAPALRIFCNSGLCACACRHTVTDHVAPAPCARDGSGAAPAVRHSTRQRHRAGLQSTANDEEASEPSAASEPASRRGRTRRSRLADRARSSSADNDGGREEGEEVGEGEWSEEGTAARNTTARTAGAPSAARRSRGRLARSGRGRGGRKSSSTSGGSSRRLNHNAVEQRRARKIKELVENVKSHLSVRARVCRPPSTA